MKRSKRILMAVGGLLGIASPVIAATLGIATPAVAIACLVTMFAGAIALASALPFSRWHKKPTHKPKEDEKLPLTTANLETLMPGTAGLFKEDKDAIQAQVRLNWEKMETRRREERRETPRLTAAEQRQRLLSYHPIQATDPARMGDHTTVSTDIFSYNPKKKDQNLEELRTLMDKAFPPWPSRTHAHPRPLSRPIERGYRKTIRETAASFRNMAATTPDDKTREILLKLAAEADTLDQAKRKQALNDGPLTPEIMRDAARKHLERAENAPTDQIRMTNLKLAAEYETKAAAKEAE